MTTREDIATYLEQATDALAVNCKVISDDRDLGELSPNTTYLQIFRSKVRPATDSPRGQKEENWTLDLITGVVGPASAVELDTRLDEVCAILDATDLFTWTDATRGTHKTANRPAYSIPLTLRTT